jgi:hypothetical protein
MSDFKQVVKGPTYTGPDDATILNVITAYGTQRGCFHSYIVKHFGPGTAAWTETLDEKLARLVRQGKLTESVKIRKRYFQIT